MRRWDHEDWAMGGRQSKNLVVSALMELLDDGGEGGRGDGGGGGGITVVVVVIAVLMVFVLFLHLLCDWLLLLPLP